MKRALWGLLLLWPMASNAECFNLKEAKQKWPDQHLSWRGDHCWYADRMANDKKSDQRPDMDTGSNTVPVPVIVPVPTPTAQAQEPTSSSNPASVPPVLTAERLIEHGINRQMEEEMRTKEELLHCINDMIDAWEALPGGRNYSAVVVRNWLAEKMAPSINRARETIGRKKPGETP